jgi:arabinose-5-phosphate isomerase
LSDKLTNDELLDLAREVLAIESRAVDSLRSRLDENFIAACELCKNVAGRIVVTGMGKSGHVSNKIAATLASTGTPAFFMHPAEASHGDLGMITSQDLLLAISYSGETAEVVTILPVVKRIGAKLLRSLSAKSRADCKYHRNAGNGRCARRGAPQAPRFYGGRLRPLAPQR